MAVTICALFSRYSGSTFAKARQKQKIESKGSTEAAKLSIIFGNSSKNGPKA
jgi:fructose-specific component phosphotransferase system IIB-like protein